MRSLARRTWWRPSELSAAQATVDDRRRLWVALDHEAELLAASAQGWMNVLIAQRSTLQQDEPPLQPPDAQRMRNTFHELETSRENIADRAGRPFRPFVDSGVLATLPKPDTTLKELGLAG